MSASREGGGAVGGDASGESSGSQRHATVVEGDCASGSAGRDGAVKVMEPLMVWDPLESTCRHASLSIL